MKYRLGSDGSQVNLGLDMPYGLASHDQGARLGKVQLSRDNLSALCLACGCAHPTSLDCENRGSGSGNCDGVCIYCPAYGQWLNQCSISQHALRCYLMMRSQSGILVSCVLNLLEMEALLGRMTN